MYTSKMIDRVGDTTDGYIALAHAVVKLACQDYIAALKDLDKNPNNEKAFWRKGECENFFENEMERYAEADPDYIIEHCKEKAREQIEKRKRQKERK